MNDILPDLPLMFVHQRFVTETDTKTDKDKLTQSLTIDTVIRMILTLQSLYYLTTANGFQ